MKLIDPNGVVFEVPDEELKRLPFFEHLMEDILIDEAPFEIPITMYQFLEVVFRSRPPIPVVLRYLDFYGFEHPMTHIQDGQIVSHPETEALYNQLGDQSLKTYNLYIRRSLLLEAILHHDSDLSDQYFVEYFGEDLQQNPWMFYPGYQWIYERYTYDETPKNNAVKITPSIRKGYELRLDNTSSDFIPREIDDYIKYGVTPDVLKYQSVQPDKSIVWMNQPCGMLWSGKFFLIECVLRFGHLKMAEALLRHGIDINATSNSHSALSEAISFHEYENAKWLIQHGAKVDQINLKYIFSRIYLFPLFGKDLAQINDVCDFLKFLITYEKQLRIEELRNDLNAATKISSPQFMIDLMMYHTFQSYQKLFHIDYNTLKVKELRLLLLAQKLAVSGNKDKLVERLRAYDLKNIRNNTA